MPDRGESIDIVAHAFTPCSAAVLVPNPRGLVVVPPRSLCAASDFLSCYPEPGNGHAADVVVACAEGYALLLRSALDGVGSVTWVSVVLSGSSSGGWDTGGSYALSLVQLVCVYACVDMCVCLCVFMCVHVCTCVFVGGRVCVPWVVRALKWC